MGVMFSPRSDDKIATALPSPAARYRVDSLDPALLAYLQSCFAGARTEQLRVIYCDQRQGYLCDDLFAHGQSDSIITKVRPLFERALGLGANALLLAHNHPSGNCLPSQDDIRSTRYLRYIGAALDVDLIDHLIFAGRRCFSMAGGGYL
ncbi:MAG: hypothetical protein KJZ64_12760 [Sphingomonadaceae bacterium]|nr:hypothetical protein [Sphingomonadaceae bacterium]